MIARCRTIHFADSGSVRLTNRISILPNHVYNIPIRYPDFCLIGITNVRPGKPSKAQSGSQASASAASQTSAQPSSQIQLRTTVAVISSLNGQASVTTGASQTAYLTSTIPCSSCASGSTVTVTVQVSAQQFMSPRPSHVRRVSADLPQLLFRCALRTWLAVPWRLHNNCKHISSRPSYRDNRDR